MQTNTAMQTYREYWETSTEPVQIRDITQLPESSGEVQYEHILFGKDSLLEYAYKHYERLKRHMKNIHMKHDDGNHKLLLI